MKHYYADIPKLGNVAISRHAQKNLIDDFIPEEEFEEVLLKPIREVKEGFDVVWREGKGIRIVILLRPNPFRGACLVKTIYRIKAQEKV